MDRAGLILRLPLPLSVCDHDNTVQDSRDQCRGRGSSGTDFCCSSVLAKEDSERAPRKGHSEQHRNEPGLWDKVDFLGYTVD